MMPWYAWAVVGYLIFVAVTLAVAYITAPELPWHD